jgi:hypothetical protein
MSIDTYDTLAIIRPGVTGPYDLNWIERLAREVAGTSGAAVARKPALPSGEFVSLSKNGVELHIYYSDEPWVAGECEEIADDCGGRCRGSTRWFELAGTDLDLVLENDHQMICERLQRTDDFVFYSPQAGLLFEDEA